MMKYELVDCRGHAREFLKMKTFNNGFSLLPIKITPTSDAGLEILAKERPSQCKLSNVNCRALALLIPSPGHASSTTFAIPTRQNPRYTSPTYTATIKERGVTLQPHLLVLFFGSCWPSLKPCQGLWPSWSDMPISSCVELMPGWMKYTRS